MVGRSRKASRLDLKNNKMKIALDGIVKEFDGQRAVDGVSLALESGEFFFLLGPSGCGKTTLLRMLAGFLEPDAGTVRFGDRPMNGVPPQDRNTALVFQNYAVWPHLTVFENVAYGLRLRKVAEPELTRRVEEALAQAQLLPLARRKPGTLSGGQQQRVALARATVVRPDLLLFDEPLSNLDAQLRAGMRAEIGRLQRAHRITSLYVTHDQEEALSLADRIAVMDKGRVRQVGTPREVYDRPADPFVAAFLGEVNLLPASGPLAAALGAGNASGTGQVGFRPERAVLAPGGIPARVESAVYFGSRSQVTLRAEGGETFRLTAADAPAPGSAVAFAVAPEHVLRFP